MTRKKLVLTAALLLAAALLYVKVFSDVTVEEMETWIRQCGIWAPLVFIACFAVLPALMFPGLVLAITGGLLFGLGWGTVYSLIGSFFNMALMFWIARYLGRDAVTQYVSTHLSLVWKRRLSQADGRQAYLLLLVLRLLPTVPYILLNYVYGLTEMSFWPYMLISMIGIIPGTVVYINMGDKAANWKSPAFWVAVGLLLLLAIVTKIMNRKLFPKDAEESENGENQYEEEQE